MCIRDRVICWHETLFILDQNRATHLPDGVLLSKEEAQCRIAKETDNLRLHNGQLRIQVERAGRHLRRLRHSVVRGPAFHDIAYVAVSAAQSLGYQHPVQQTSRLTDEWDPRQVLLTAPDLRPQNRCGHGLIRRPGQPSSGWPLACTSDKTLLPRQLKPGESLSSQIPRACWSNAPEDVFSMRGVLSRGAFPVDPKPSTPLSVGAISSTATRQTLGTSMNTNCAMRSPGNTEKGASPKFANTTFTSPR